MLKKLRQRRDDQRVITELAAAALWFIVECQHPLTSSIMMAHEYDRLERCVDTIRADNLDLYSRLKGVK